MKKIIYSAGMIVFVAALAMGATGAFFSDTETSTGNTFTAGAVDLKIDSEQHYNGNICTNTGTEQEPVYTWQGNSLWPVPGSSCDGTWALTDLQDGVHKFWNFTDVKPGDEGENTISIHIDNNPAWACIDVSLTSNDDVDCNDPENQVEGVNCPLTEVSPDGDLFDGDLAQNLKFAAWADDGDNIWEEGEPLLFSNQSGPASDVLGGKTYTLADSLTGTPLPGGSTSYIGLAWCAGTQTVNLGLNTITCDGAGMGNEAQTDSMTADVTFRVEQHRNNPNFLCTPRSDEPVVTTLTLAKAVLPPEAALDNQFTLTATGPTPISGIEGAVAVTNAPVTPGVYTLDESGGPGNELSVVWECSGNATAEVDNGDGTATVTIAAGENVVCGVTNNYPEII